MLTPYVFTSKNFSAILLFCCMAFLSCAQVFAQNPSQAAAAVSTFNVDPGLIGRTITNQLTPRVTRDVNLPREPTALSSSGIDPGDAKRISFVLNGVIIEGNCVYSDEDLQKIFTPFIHKKITLAKFLELMQQITERYNKGGYFLSKAILPPQKIARGVVKIQVLEGFINEIKVEGITGANKQMLERYGDAIKSLRPIRLSDLERYLLLMNDIPGIQVKSVLAPDPKVPLGSSMTLLTEYTKFNFIGTYDNYQTYYLGPYETTLNGFVNSVLFPGGTLLGRFLTANTYERLNYYELRHDQIFAPCGISFGIDGFLTQTHPGFILDPLEIYGMSGDANISMNYPWIRSRARNFTILGQFDYMNNSSTALGEQLYADKIRDLSLGFLYIENIWKGTSSLAASVDKGFNILGAHARGIHSRLGSSPDFIKFNFTATRNQPLDQYLSVFALVTGQYSPHPLFAAEQMIFGGPFLGRGYDLAQFTGDQAIAGKIEGRFNVSTTKFPFLTQAQIYTFFDIGKLWSLIPTVATFSQSGASTGFGIRTPLYRNLSFDGFIAKPLTAPNATKIILGKNGKSLQGYFQLTGTFSI